MRGEKKMKKEETEDAAWRMEGAAHRLQFQIEAADQGETVWNYLTRKKGFTKMQVKRMKFQQGGICINQKQVRVTHVLAAGERLEVSLAAPKQKKSKLQAESEMNSGMMPDILYEDMDVLAVWKPHGMILHPSHGHHGDTLMDRMQVRLAQRDGLEAADVPLYSIGRLDSDTSGIVVFARNQVAAQRLWQQRMDGRFQKQYLAKCEGHFPKKTDEEQCISQPVAPVPGELNRMRVGSGRKACRDILPDLAGNGERNVAAASSGDGKNTPDPGTYGMDGISACRRFSLWKWKGRRNVCGAYSLQCRFFPAIYREKDPAELP